MLTYLAKTNIIGRMEEKRIAQARLQELVNYDPLTGIFTWRIKRRKCRVGAAAGCKMRNGYIVIRLDDCLYYAHRLAWLYMTGKWPEPTVDHINRERADNRFANLREASLVQNAQNQGKRNNRTGFTGVYKENNKWRAEIRANGKRMRLGLFDSPEAAHVAYCEARKKYHPFSNQ